VEQLQCPTHPDNLRAYYLPGKSEVIGFKIIKPRPDINTPVPRLMFDTNTLMLMDIVDFEVAH